MPEIKFYKPVMRGFESKISERLTHLRELDRQAKKKPK
jgi:putative ATPase